MTLRLWEGFFKKRKKKRISNLKFSKDNVKPIFELGSSWGWTGDHTRVGHPQQ